MPTDTVPPIEIEQAIHRIVDALVNDQDLSPNDLLIIPPTGDAKTIIDALTKAKQEGGTDGVKQEFKVQHAAYPWLGNLKSKQPIPLRPGIEGEKQEEQDNQDDWRFTKGKHKKQILKFSSIEDIYNLPDPEYLISRILQTASVSLLYGVSGTGKTFTCLDLALSIAHGIPWHGRKVKQGPAWYINTEGGRALKKRLKAWYIEHPDLSPSPNLKVIPWSLDLLGDYQILLDTLKDQDEAPALITFDNFSMCTDKVNQNLQEEVAAILKRLHHIADTYGCHVMIVHHTNKEGDVNGTMAFRNHVDAMIELKKEDKSQKDSPILFSSQKARDDEPFADIRTELKQVTLYADPETGEWITSCVVTDCDRSEPERFVPHLQKQALEILEAHGKLTCNQWLKHCEVTHGMSSATFYRVKKTLTEEGFVSTPLVGKGAHFTLTDKANEILR